MELKIAFTVPVKLQVRASYDRKCLKFNKYISERILMLK